MSRRTGQVLAVGADARRLLDRAPAEIVLMPTLRAARRRTRATPLFLALCAAMVLLTVLSAQPWAFGARGAAKSALSPLIAALTNLTAPLDRLASSLTGSATLGAENQRLRAADEELRRQLLELQSVSNENAQLRQALSFEQSSGYHLVGAQVIGRGADGFSVTMEIDRGTVDGVRPGMVVVTGAGLLGRISEAGPRSAMVQTLADPRSRVDVELVNANVQGTVFGGAAPLRMSLHQPPGVTVSSGDWALTNGLSGTYPRGLVVGEVMGPAQLAWVNDPRAVTIVLVITDFKST